MKKYIETAAVLLLTAFFVSCTPIFNFSTVPSTPDGLNYGTVTSSTIYLSWDSVSNAGGYTVYWGAYSGGVIQ